MSILRAYVLHYIIKKCLDNSASTSVLAFSGKICKECQELCTVFQFLKLAIPTLAPYVDLFVVECCPSTRMLTFFVVLLYCTYYHHS